MGKNRVRRFQRFVIVSGDIVTALLLVVIYFLDTTGVLLSWFPNLESKNVLWAVFGTFVVFHIVQRLKFNASRPELSISDEDWEVANNTQRLYLEVSNQPIVSTSAADSKNTGVEVRIYTKQGFKIHDYHDVRWQSTPAPGVLDRSQGLQPHMNWTVTLTAQEKRRVYILAKDGRDNKYAHNDSSYDNNNVKGWYEDRLKLPDATYFISATLFSSDFDAKPFWYRLDDLTPVRIKKPKHIKEA